MGRLEFCGLLGRYVKHLQSNDRLRLILCSRLVQHQHLDDIIRKHRRRSFMVAILDMCLGMETGI